MISVTITRKELEDLDACEEGLELFDAVAPDGTLHIPEWTQLHTAMLRVAYGSFANWAAEKRVIPNANISGADLSGAYLYGAYLSGANLYKANLSGANLSWANLSGANLSWANLSGAYLYGANLYWADLSVADLYGANLSGAYLYGANLYWADLSGANLFEADLSGAYRPTDPPAGWKPDASGRLVRA